MANNAFRNPANVAVAQVWKGTVTATTDTNTYVLTLTASDGTTAAITYTVANPPDTTVTLIALGIITAWNASANPQVSRITASQLAGQVILTADTAGIPFSVAATGTGTWSGTGTTTANVGNNDYGTARNWQLDAAPVATNDVLIDVSDTNTSVDLLYTLNQSAVAIADFRVFPGYRGKIGRFDNGLPMYLRIDPDAFRYEGSGQLALFDIGSANIDCYINSRGVASQGRHAVNLKGSNIATVYHQRGDLAIAPFDADTATVATINQGFEDSPQDTSLLVGTGVTLTALNQEGGSADVRCAVPTINNGVNCALTTQGSGAITTLNAYGVAIPNSTGTITNLNVYGTVDLTRIRAARTITNLKVYPGGRLIIGSWITLTNGIALPTGVAGVGHVEYRT